VRIGDDEAIRAAAAPASLAHILRLAKGRRRVVEIGTFAGWSALALALAEPDREVVSVDPVEWPTRSRYVDLVPPEVSARISFVEGRGEDRPLVAGVEFLFIDGSHECEDTAAAFMTWRPALATRSTVVFHDADWPGVRQAIAELGLECEIEARSFVWRP
jgi:predicted O-methyltransferase YrrM